MLMLLEGYWNLRLNVKGRRETEDDNWRSKLWKKVQRLV